jgi:predicted DNA-binding ribbon-helix-helix protein
MGRHRFTVDLNDLEHDKLKQICEHENLSKTKAIAKLIKNKRVQDKDGED